MPALVHGAYDDIDPAHAQVFAYTRSRDDQRYLVLINFGRQAVADYALPADLRIGGAVLDNGAGATAAPGQSQVSLAPWQATVYRLK